MTDTEMRLKLYEALGILIKHDDKNLFYLQGLKKLAIKIRLHIEHEANDHALKFSLGNLKAVCVNILKFYKHYPIVSHQYVKDITAIKLFLDRQGFESCTVKLDEKVL